MSLGNKCSCGAQGGGQTACCTQVNGQSWEKWPLNLQGHHIHTGWASIAGKWARLRANQWFLWERRESGGAPERPETTSSMIHFTSVWVLAGFIFLRFTLNGTGSLPLTERISLTSYRRTSQHDAQYVYWSWILSVTPSCYDSKRRRRMSASNNSGKTWVHICNDI